MVVAFVISVIVENGVYRTFPPTEGFTAGDPAAVAHYIANLPDKGFWMTVAGWFLSAAAGGLVACLIGRQELLRLVGVVTVAVLAGSVSQAVLAEYPRWVISSAVFATLLGGVVAYSISMRLRLGLKTEGAIRKLP
jgi:hypothetical protein